AGPAALLDRGHHGPGRKERRRARPGLRGGDPPECPGQEGSGRAGKRLRRRPDRVFAFRLAERLGLTVRRLLAEMDSREFAEWMALAMNDHEDTLRAELARRAE